MSDYGNGPVAGYRLYYGLQGSSLTSYKDVSGSDGSILGSEIEKTYDFTVAVLRSIDGVTFAGKQGSVVSEKTQCLGEYVVHIYTISSQSIIQIHSQHKLTPLSSI